MAALGFALLFRPMRFLNFSSVVSFSCSLVNLACLDAEELLLSLLRLKIDLDRGLCCGDSMTDFALWIPLGKCSETGVKPSAEDPPALTGG